MSDTEWKVGISGHNSTVWNKALGVQVMRQYRNRDDAQAKADQMNRDHPVTATYTMATVQPPPPHCLP